MPNQPTTETLPLIPTRGLVVFPYMMVHFDIGREKSARALEAAMAGDQNVFLVAQKDIEFEEPGISDLYTIGCIVKVKQIVKLPGDTIRVLVEGLRRAKLIGFIDTGSYLSCEVEPVSKSVQLDDTSHNALLRQLKEAMESYFSGNSKLNAESMLSMMAISDIGQLSDTIAANLSLEYQQRQEILECIDIYERVTKLIAQLASELEILKVEQEIAQKVKTQIDQNQKEYYLREQLKAISDELGEKDGLGAELSDYKKRCKKANLPSEVREKVEQEIERLSKTSFGSPEGAVIRTYLDSILALPWAKKTRERYDLDKAQKILDADHYGLDKVKERILEYLAVRKLTKSIHGPILCFVGPPGVGKTSIAKSIAKALNRKYARISLGGLRDEADIRGHRKTYIGSMPGRIMNAIKLAGTQNPLMLLDEVDKMSQDFRGDPASALLEVLDAEQNYSFRDHYLEVPFDLSDVLFITTANSTETIPPALLDRLEVIELGSYTTEEKMGIAKYYLLPKQKKQHGLSDNQLLVDDEAIEDIINYYTREAGVRRLERKLADICRKSAKAIISDKKHSVTVTSLTLPRYLGPHKFRLDTVGEDEIGVVCGLAWTSVGGETLDIEVGVMPGTGKLELTGQLGDIMRESAQTAISYVRSQCAVLGIRENFYKTLDIHIHVPKGAVPKDGPSAGITMATALVSALTGYCVRSTVAMTGEITLRGRVLSIGGLKEKSLAAYRTGIKTVIFPEENKRDLDEIPADLKEHLNFIPASNMQQVLEHALCKKKAPSFELPLSDMDKKIDLSGSAARMNISQPPISQ